MIPFPRPQPPIIRGIVEYCMDTKRLVLAIALSIVIFLGWNYLSLHMGWIKPPTENAAVNATAGAPGASAASAVDPSAPSVPLSTASLPAFTPTQGRQVTVETPLYKAVFHTAGGLLREFSLKGYRTSIKEGSPLVNLVSPQAAGQAPMGLLLDGIPTWTNTEWAFEGNDLSLAADGSGVLRFVADIAGVRVTRELTFSGSNYTVTEKTYIASAAAKTLNVAYTFGASSLAIEESPSMLSRLRHAVFGGTPPVAEESQYNHTRVAWFQDGSFSEDGSVSDLKEGKLLERKVSWMGVMNNYFLGAVSMDDATASAKGRYIDGVFHVLIGKTGVAVGEDKGATVECSYFMGPKVSGILGAAPNHLEKAIDYGMFSIIAKPLVQLLQFFYGYVHNYGLAIILMTVLIKLVFWPLSQKSYKSMQQMKQLQPLMTKIREKYADDKETMNREIMQLYKTYKVNPAGGCLPILVQIPVFFGLYQALLNSIELRHAPFITHLPFTDKIWLADLAAQDPYCITPLVMGATMFLQQKMTPTPGDPTQAKVMMFMPLIFTVLFINFPAGLVVYWLVNNVISISQQWWQLRRS